MATIDRNTLTQEQIQKAMACNTADELMKVAKAEGFDLTHEEAEATWPSFPTSSWTKRR